MKELGVGITLLPHAMREFAALGLGDELLRAGIENAESCFFNRFGQLIYKEPRGKLAGYQYPGSRHPSRPAAPDALPGRARAARRDCVIDRPSLRRRRAGRERRHACCSRRRLERRALPPVAATIVIACDGVNSAVRKQFYPDDKRGVHRHQHLARRHRGASRSSTGRSYMRVGSIHTGKIVIYPIVDDVDGEGNQLINWMAEIKRDTDEKNDWNKPGNLEDFIPIYKDWRFDWLDVAELIRRSPSTFSNIRWSTRTRSIAGPSAASRSPAMPRIRCIRAARTARRRA